ncbi:MAG: STAS-like domain-containing protein [Longimicrobiaceae bacterium]
MANGKALIVHTHENEVHISGGLGLVEFRRVLAAMRHLISRQGHNKLVLNFANCHTAYGGPMLAICCEVIRQRRSGFDFELVLPESPRLRNMFQNANWAHLLDPRVHAPSRFRGFTNVPAIQFSSPHEQNAAVNKLIDVVLSSMQSLSRGDLAGIEWSLNEITDNVLVHSHSEIGGLVQLTNNSFRRRVEFVVADAGIGIPTSLRQGHPEITSDTVALEYAVQEGVTRSTSVGQGNGLYGTFQIAEVSHGFFQIHSEYARLLFDQDQLRIRSDQIPIQGSLVVVSMNVSTPAALADALRFKGAQYEPTDWVETRYERGENELVFELKKEASSFGSRVAGQPIRIKLANLIRMNPGARIIIDFTDIPLVSSSFADEVIAKLYVDLGPMAFMRATEMRNVAPTVQALIDRAILQRTRTGL